MDVEIDWVSAGIITWFFIATAINFYSSNFTKEIIETCKRKTLARFVIAIAIMLWPISVILMLVVVITLAIVLFIVFDVPELFDPEEEDEYYDSPSLPTGPSFASKILKVLTSLFAPLWIIVWALLAILFYIFVEPFVRPRCVFCKKRMKKWRTPLVIDGVFEPLFILDLFAPPEYYCSKHPDYHKLGIGRISSERFPT